MQTYVCLCACVCVCDCVLGFLHWENGISLDVSIRVSLVRRCVKAWLVVVKGAVEVGLAQLRALSLIMIGEGGCRSGFIGLAS